MGFRAKGFHEKSAEMSGESPRKRHRGSDGSDDDDEYTDDEHVSPSIKLSSLQAPSYSFTTQQDPAQMLALASNLFSMSRPAMPTRKEDFSFQPQLPLPVNLTDAEGGISFLDTASALLNRFYVAGIDAWSTVLSIARMTLVSKGWSTPPTMEDAERLTKEYEAKHPGGYIIALDPTTRSLKDRIMALSPGAVGYLGPVARNQNGLDRRLIPLSDAWAALTAAFAAYKTPCVEVSVKLSILCQDGVLRPAQCFFCMHPQERLLMLRAAPPA